MLGAGGSARAAVWALLDAGAAEVAIWNRTPDRARELAEELGAQLAADVSRPADILVNCTSVGLHDGNQLERLSLSADQLARHRVVVDFVSPNRGTELIRTAHDLGIESVDGLELLLGQGTIAFRLLTGAEAPVAAMRRALALCSAP